MKVAQPRPYKPGSDVSILTTTSGMTSGAVRMTLTLVIVMGFDMAVSLYVRNMNSQ